MQPFKVLVPLDGSRLAEESLTYLRSLQRIGEMEVLLLSVVDETEDFSDLTAEEVIDREANVMATYLREVSADVARHLGIAVQTEVKRGSPSIGILAAAEAFSPDVLLITTHGRSGISRWRLGSVADKVIRAAQCDTLVIGPKAVPAEAWSEAFLNPEFKAILVPLDGSALSEVALPAARRYADAFGSVVHLVRVVPVPTMGDGMGINGGDILVAMTDAARTYLERMAAEVHAPGGVRQDAPIGTAAWALEEYIEANSIDLVIMTSHGRGGILRTALGSVTDRLLGSRAPVLVVRARTS